MNIADEFKQDFDPLDATKKWPEDKFPLILVGKMVLSRNPENYFAEVEQAAFCPAPISTRHRAIRRQTAAGKGPFLLGHAAAPHGN
jgi:hypothetical protein